MKCSGINCPMQYPYDVKKCLCVDTCPYATTVPYTNAERIRAMSDEELAAFLERVHVDPCSACCDNCKQKNWGKSFPYWTVCTRKEKNSRRVTLAVARPAEGGLTWNG